MQSHVVSFLNQGGREKEESEVLEWAVLSPALNTDVVLCLLPYSDSTAKQSALRMFLACRAVLSDQIQQVPRHSMCGIFTYTTLGWVWGEHIPYMESLGLLVCIKLTLPGFSDISSSYVYIYIIYNL